MIINRDQAYRVLCSIRSPIQGGEEESGTGMFVNKNNSLWIITASHVARPSNQNSYLILSNDQGKAERLPVNMFSPSPVWTHHPVTDIAAMPVTETTENPDISIWANNRTFLFCVDSTE